MVAALHQLKIIEFGEAGLFLRNGLNEDLVVVVAEHEDVGQLDGSVAAHTHTRRDTLHDGAFGGADCGGGAGGIVIGIQIHHTHQALADGAVLQCTLHIDKSVLVGLEHVIFQILRHGRVDKGGMLRLLLRAQFRLRQDEVDGGRRTLGVLPYTLPVGRVGGKLVAGNHRPFLHGIHLRHQNISG